MSRSDRIALAAGVCALILAAAAAWVLLTPPASGSGPAGPSVVSVVGAVPSLTAGVGSSVAPDAGPIVVDVEGAVAEPGVHVLAPGSRVADAVAAAGGYAEDVDLDAAAAAINLAAPVADGQQIVIPRVGSSPATAGASSAPGPVDGQPPATGGVDLNTASAEELEALPGIGPVTVEKILAARAERPFTSLEDAVARGALNRGQLEDIQGLATAG